MKKVVLSIALTGLFAVATVNTIQAFTGDNTVLCEDGKDGKKSKKKKSCCKKDAEKKSCCKKGEEKKSCHKSATKKTEE